MDAFLLLLSVGLVASGHFHAPMFPGSFSGTLPVPRIFRIPAGSRSNFNFCLSYAACVSFFTGCFISDSIFPGSYLSPLFRSA